MRATFCLHIWAWSGLASAAVVTDTAVITTQPKVEDRLVRALADGSIRRGLVFPVGSKGDATITIRFLRARPVSGLRFYQNSPVYYSTKFRVRADCDGDGRFEKTLAEAQCRPPYEWTEARWPEIRVHALRWESVEGVSKGKRAHPCLGELEVFGKPLPTDAEDARRAGWPVRRLSQVRPIRRRIDLSGRTRPVVVLHPNDAAGRTAAQTIAARLRSRGATRVSVTADQTHATPARANVVALGNVNDNELIARLYWNAYAYEDALLPGPAGWSLRTVFDPYPWHGKGDVVVVGYSRPADAARAAKAFTRALSLREGSAGMDYRIEVSTASAPSAAQRRLLERNKAPNFRMFLRSAQEYLRTGREAYARHAIATLERIVKVQENNPDWFYDWPEETSSGRIMAVWDAFEECPLMTDAQRFAFTRAFLRFMRLLPRHVSGYGRLGKNDLITWNHTTFPLLGLYFGARYFHDYYGLTETDEYLAKAKACFLAQARCWKPQEDADSYMTLTMNHTITYCLAEWRVDLLRETGIVAKFADYVIGFCDSAGLSSGFGDSGLSRRPYLLKNVLPRAFWFTRDPGYLWVLQHTQGKDWRTRFHPEIRPVEPRRFLGLKVFPLAPQVYEFTKTQRFYALPPSAPNVPASAAFDKISLRASWDKRGQYALLDGFSRGKHLHFDGNAIIEFVGRGRRWLIDHDYLTRNTTEHNMLSVIRNGRADQLEPSCAGIVCKADPGGRVALVTTEVRDWLGVDWRRSLFWLKGDCLVVMDRVTARDAADYDLDLAWKVACRSDEYLRGREFVVLRPEASGRTRGVFVVDDQTASAGKAVVLATKDAELSFVANLPAGNLRVAVYGYGYTTSSDSVYVSIGGAPAAACGLPLDRYGPSREKPNFTGRPTTPILSKRSGRQVVTVRLRENPPVHLDKLVFFDAKGRRLCAVEAESAPKPTEADVAGLPAERFFIKWDDAFATRVVSSHPKGIVVPVTKLYQRWSAALRPGQSVEFANLLYADNSQSPRPYGIRRLGPGAVLLTGDAPALLALRGAKLPGLESDADMLWLSPKRIAWCNARSVRFASCRIDAPARCSGELDVASGRVVGAKNVKVSGATEAAVRRWLNGLRPQPLARATRSGERKPQKLAALWVYDAPNAKPARVRVADLDRDGRPEILAAMGSAALALRAEDGKALWRFQIAGKCADVFAAELAPAKGLETLVAGGDSFAYILSAEGKVLSKHQIRGPVWNQNYGDRPWPCTNCLAADLDRDGRPEIVLGTNSMELRLFTPQWKPLAVTRRSVLHGGIDFIPIDLDRDGKLELVATDHYGRMSIFSCDGKKLAAYYTSIGDMQAAAADLDGDGHYELIAGSSTGDLVCWSLPAKRPFRAKEKRWRFDNFGYGVNRIRTADLDGDGRPEALVASQTGYVYALNAAGRAVWRRRVGADVVECLVLPGRRILAFDRSGAAMVLGFDGGVRRRFDLGMEVACAARCGDRVIVAGPGRLAAYDVFLVPKLRLGTHLVGRGDPPGRPYIYIRNIAEAELRSGGLRSSAS